MKAHDGYILNMRNKISTLPDIQLFSHHISHIPSIIDFFNESFFVEKKIVLVVEAVMHPECPTLDIRSHLLIRLVICMREISSELNRKV